MAHRATLRRFTGLTAGRRSPSTDPAIPLAELRRAVRFVTRGHRRNLAKVAVTAYLGGMAEAMFLIIVTRAAFAVTEHHQNVGVVADWYLSVDATLLLALLVVLVRIALALYANRQSVHLSTGVVADVRHRLARAFLDSSWGIQQEQRSGSLQELMTGFSNQASGVMASVSGGVVAGANLVAMVAMAVSLNPLGALLLTGSVCVVGLMLGPLRAAVRRRARAATGANLDFAVSVNEVADLGLELHVFQVQGAARQRVGGFIEQAKRENSRLQFAAGMSSPLYAGLAYLTLVGALAFVAASSSQSLTSLGASMLVMLRSLSYGQALQGSYMGVSASAPAMEELQRRLRLFEAARARHGRSPVGHVGTLSAERVTFSYPGGPAVLKDVSFSIDPSEIVGIVGPSGSGKSTLVQLLLGLREPDSGRILADGRDIAGLDRGEWARKVTFVPQAAHLVAGSVAENIRFFRDGVDQAEIERAARLAHIDDEIEGFRLGYDHQVGERGSHLSGGQQQRLCIARALVEKPEVLILDEPTSALDVRSEHLIRTSLVDLKENMTVIVIAHRMSTLSVCDRIMVIQGGELRGFDRPSDLEHSSPFYREVLSLSGLR